MADKKFDLVFNASLEVGQVKAAVASLTKSLESAGARIPQSMTTNLNRMIQSLSTELNKLEGMTDIELDPKNAKNVGKSYEKIFQTFQQIKAALSDINRTAGIDPEKFFPSEIASNIAKAAQAVQKYKKTMEAGVKTDEYTQTSKDIAKANKETEDLQKKLNEAIRKRDEASNTKQVLQNQRAELQAKKDAADAEVKAAKDSEKVIKDKIEFQKRMAQIEADIAKKKKAQQAAVDKAAKANEVKNERESMKQAKGKGTDTKIYREAVASYAESTAEVQKLQSEIDQLESEFTQLSQSATVSNDDLTAATEKVTKATEELSSAQKSLNKNQAAMDTEDTRYAAAIGEIQTLTPEVQKAEQALEQLRLKKQQLEANFEQATFNELIQELEKLGVKLPDTERSMEGVERALESIASQARGEVASALNGIKEAAEDIEKPMGEIGRKADDVGELGEQARRAEQDMENLKNQVFDFFSITNTIQIFKNAIRDAFDTVKELDAAMTETAVVTDFSVGDMWEKLPEYSEQATKLGASIKSLYEATTLYYQQGLNSEQAMDVGIETMKMARIANMDAAAATEAMTAALRGFNMEINETSATRINDVYSELAAVTAADTSQIATAMSKTASIAESANMEFETTAALLAQIIETTQEAPETAGTAMKTIIARFTEVKQLFSEGMLTGEDSEGEGIDINKIDAALKTVGISLKDFLTGAKGIDDIFLELASKWDTLDLATQRYIATTAAGSRQQSRFLAMMGNYERTMELVTAANNSAGASQKQFDKTLESLDAKLQKLKNAWDTFTMGLANNELIKAGVDLLTKLLETANDLTDDLGGTIGSIAKLGITLAALKAGKNIFNSIFDIAPLEQNIGKVKGASTIIATALTKIGITADTEVSKKMDKAKISVGQFTTGITVAGVAIGAFAQYLRAIGMDDFATALEIVGGALIMVGTGLSFVNSVAQAAGMSITVLAGKLAAAFVAALPAIAAVAAIIAVVGIAMKKIYDNSAAGKLKAAKKAAEAAGEAAQDAAEAYNNLTSAINSIDDKTEALSELTRGTNEWREAVIALNGEILKLVETYPELAGFIENEGGVLKIDYEKIVPNKYGEEQTANDILNSYLRKQTETQQIYNRKQIDEKQAEIDLEYSKSMRDFADSLSFIDIEKAEKESETGSAWEDARKIVDKLSIEIAKGSLQTDETSIQNWLKEQNVQTRDFEEFDYSVFKTYGDYLLSQQVAIDGLTDATIAAQMAMIKLTNISTEASEAVLNFDDNILRKAYNNQLDEAKTRELTEEDKKAYAEFMGYTYEETEVRHLTSLFTTTVGQYFDKNNKLVKITDNEVRDFIVNRATNEDFTEVLQKIGERFDDSSDTQKELFTEVFANSIQELSFDTLSRYGTYQNQEFSFSKDTSIRDTFAEALNYDSFQEMADVFELAPEQLARQIEQIFTQGGAEFIKVRKNLVKNITKFSTGAQKDFDVNTNLLNLLEAKYKDLDISGILSDIISKLELTGDEEFSTAAYESLRDIMMKADSAAEMKEALNFFNEIDFNNPIDALDTINNEIKSGTGYSKELAIAMKDANSSFLSASSQMSTLFQSADFENIKEDLDDIIEKNSEISASDVFDLTKSYKSLDKVLKNNGMTANGLAEILEQISEGTLKVDELTEAVLAAMSSFESLNSIAAKSVKFFEDFDLGIDESIIGETIVEWGDLILENMEKGAVGNSQNFRILDVLFPDWDDGIETAEARIAEMSRLGNLLKGNGQNLRQMWSDIYAGKDYKGNDISLSAESQKMGLSVRDTGEEIIFEGWEGKNLTSVDLVSWISDAYEVSTEMAEAMLTDFKNYSGDLAAELRDNDYAVGIEKAYETLKQFGDIKLVDEREIETIAKLLGANPDTVKTDLANYAATQGTEITYSQFYTDEGKVKSFEEIQTFMDNLSTSGAQAGKKWSDEFITTSSAGIEQLDVTKLEKQLGEIGITGINAEGLKQQAFEAIQSGLKTGAEEGKAEIIHTLANGEPIAVEITANTTYEEYQQQVVAKTQQNENAAMAEAFKNAFENIEVIPSISENTIIEFRNKIEEAANQAQPKVSVTLSEESTTNIQNQLTDATDDPKEVPADIRVKSSNIDNYLWKRKVYVDIVVDKNEIPGATSSSRSSNRDTSAYWDSRRAKGIKDAPRAETSLVSEEGPELIQKANGNAYLSGTSGPEVVDIEKGDTVYTAEETKDIFKKRNHNVFPRYASGYGSGNAYLGTGSGGKGSGNSDDKEDWENPFDKLYNLVREIDEELRRRERLERRYEKLLESVDLTSGKLFDNAVEQLRQLEKEKLLNKELQEARRSQIQQYQQENADLMKYAKVVQNERGEDVLRIHWDQIDLVEDPEQGQRIEDYVSQLEEWFDSLEEAEDKLNDIEDRIEEVKELGKEEYLDFENTVKDAITFAYQEEIDKLSEINESINDTNSQLIDAISKQVNRIRQQRENERTEQELREKQRQLLYLSQDTSGTNDMAILELRKEIEEGTVDYTDTLIDQKIDELQMQNDEAAQQREQQITLMQAQLDHLIKSGEIWDEVYSLMDEGLDPEAGLIRGSRLEQILKSAENFDGMSKVQQMDWLKELQQQAAQAVVYMRLTTEKIDTAVELNRQNHFGGTTPEPEYNGSSSGGSGGGSGGGGSFGGGSGFNNGGSSNSNSIVDFKAVMKSSGRTINYRGTKENAMKNFSSNYYYLYDANGNELYGQKQPGTSSSNNSNNANNNTTSTPKYTKVQVTYANGKKVTYNYNSDWRSLAEYWKKSYGGSYTYRAYKTGGLADFTGPAWLDGTKSRPELVLNQKDTQNFIQLKDILASLMTGPQTSTENNGDITYDIDINVESIGSDYDVEQVANKIKSLINEDARYRNNNAVSLKR